MIKICYMADRLDIWESLLLLQITALTKFRLITKWPCHAEGWLELKELQYYGLTR